MRTYMKRTRAKRWAVVTIITHSGRAYLHVLRNTQDTVSHDALMRVLMDTHAMGWYCHTDRVDTATMRRLAALKGEVERWPLKATSQVMDRE